MDPDPEAGGPKTCGSGGSGSATLVFQSLGGPLKGSILFLEISLFIILGERIRSRGRAGAGQGRAGGGGA